MSRYEKNSDCKCRGWENDKSGRLQIMGKCCASCMKQVNCNRAEDAVACPVDCSPDDWRVDDACRPSPRGRRRVLRSVGLLTVCSSRSALPTSSNDFLPNSVSSFSSLVNPARFLCRTKDSASSSGVFIVKCDKNPEDKHNPELSAKINPTIEDIRAAVKGGKHEKFFKKGTTDSDGHRDGLTRKGYKLSARLGDILYAVARLESDVEDLVEILDAITREED